MTTTTRTRRWMWSVAISLIMVSGLDIATAMAADPADLTYPGVGTFVDDDGGHHEPNIEALFAAGIVGSCEAGSDHFCPNEEISRGLFAAWIDRAFNLPETTDDFFLDDNQNEYQDSINRVAAAAITKGCEVGRFCPERRLLRGQMTSFLVRTLQHWDSETNKWDSDTKHWDPDNQPQPANRFTDDETSIHHLNINLLAEMDIAMGCREGSFCPDRWLTRAQTASFLARALKLAPITPPPVPWQLELVIDDIDGGITDLQAPAGDDRLFLMTRDGRIRIISDGKFLDDPFLDLSAEVLIADSSERGMLGLAFHPSYGTNRKFYVFYTDLDGHSQIFEYQADESNPNRANLDTARHIIEFEHRKTARNHYGGQLQFGDDGYLYVSVGDGGGVGDPYNHGQNPQTIRGTIIRIDINDGDPYAIPPDNPFINQISTDGVAGLPEILAYGLRNPWRFSLDSNLIYIGDVGANEWEEVNISEISNSTINYGWNITEGLQCYRAKTCDKTGLTLPVVQYGHDQGVSVIGGYVYRGTAIPELEGTYFYGDFAGGWIRSFVYDGEVTQHYDWSRVVDSPRFIWSFGVDGHGELYVLGRWSLWKIVSVSTSTADTNPESTQ